jgi:hypothetical protein
MYEFFEWVSKFSCGCEVIFVKKKLYTQTAVEKVIIKLIMIFSSCVSNW